MADSGSRCKVAATTTPYSAVQHLQPWLWIACIWQCPRRAASVVATRCTLQPRNTVSVVKLSRNIYNSKMTFIEFVWASQALCFRISGKRLPLIVFQLLHLYSVVYGKNEHCTIIFIELSPAVKQQSIWPQFPIIFTGFIAFVAKQFSQSLHASKVGLKNARSKTAHSKENDCR